MAGMREENKRAGHIQVWLLVFPDFLASHVSHVAAAAAKARPLGRHFPLRQAMMCNLSGNVYIDSTMLDITISHK